MTACRCDLQRTLRRLLASHIDKVRPPRLDAAFCGIFNGRGRLRQIDDDAQAAARICDQAVIASHSARLDPPAIFEGDGDGGGVVGLLNWPLPNVWAGTSVCDQADADRFIPELLQTPAAIRFVSYEPALGPVRFDMLRREPDAHDRELPGFDPQDIFYTDALTGVHGIEYGDAHTETAKLLPSLDWIIAGGESGKNARPARLDWFRSVRGQCTAAQVPFFFKQWGEWIDADEFLAACKPEVDAGWHPPLNFDEATALAGMTFAPYEHQSDGSTLIRVGKRRAGRLLDGVEHSAFPSISETRGAG